MSRHWCGCEPEVRDLSVDDSDNRYHCLNCGKDLSPQDLRDRIVELESAVEVWRQMLGGSQASLEDKLVCSFCYRRVDLCAWLIRGPSNICICSSCVEICNEEIVEASKRKEDEDEDEEGEGPIVPDHEPHEDPRK